MNTINCLFCENNFHPHPWTSEKFCCRKCYFSYRTNNPSVYKNPLKGKNNSGKNNARYGVEVTIETRKKMSLAQKGVKKPYLMGEKNGRWQGGITPINKLIRHSLDYRVWRKLVFEKDKYTCQKCNERGKILRAHHIESFDNNPRMRTQIENGITLCKSCHQKFHYIYGMGNNTIKQMEEFFN